jgi:hypothetical protein
MSFLLGQPFGDFKDFFDSFDFVKDFTFLAA